MYNMSVSMSDLLNSRGIKFSSYRIELDENGREVRGSLYCLPCHTKLDIPVCAACRCLIDGRIINALGKQWHVEV